MSQADWQRIAQPWSKMLAIDGGLSGTGLALFERDATGIMHPTRVDVFTPKKTLGYMAKAQAIVDFILVSYFSSFSESYSPGGPSFHGVLEFPAYQEGAQRSMGWKSGDLQKLTYLIGVLTAGIPWTRVTHVLPRDWKGQLPKDVVERRLRRDLGEDVCQKLAVKTHGWDALGIGLHVLGRFGPTTQNPLPEPSPAARVSVTTSSGGPQGLRIRRKSKRLSTTSNATASRTRS
jgi:hypothetical protein